MRWLCVALAVPLIGAATAWGVAERVAPVQALGSVSRCAAYDGLPADFGPGNAVGTVAVPAGRYAIGSMHGYAEERPVIEALLAAFRIDATEVSNAQFARFVDATGYVTDAEREGGGAVFRQPVAGEALSGAASWWRWVDGADWRHPEGPDSSIKGHANEPVVQVTRADAQAYAAWLGRDLPSEAEWEAAARGGIAADALDRQPRDPAGLPRANFWQGSFPFDNTAEDGFARRAPVGCFAANGFGAFDMIGNVWEWTVDAYLGERQPHGSGEPEAVRTAAGVVAEGVVKGGSYLCAANFCVRYRSSARHPQQVDLPTSHVGFRTVLHGA